VARTIFVYTILVPLKNVTLSAEQDLIDRAREVARGRRSTLNQAFRDWLEQYVARAGDATAYRSLMRRLKHINAGGPYSRDEMNER
jgi:hypothetical protein